MRNGSTKRSSICAVPRSTVNCSVIVFDPRGEPSALNSVESFGDGRQLEPAVNVPPSRTERTPRRLRETTRTCTVASSPSPAAKNRTAGYVTPKQTDVEALPPVGIESACDPKPARYHGSLSCVTTVAPPASVQPADPDSKPPFGAK